MFVCLFLTELSFLRVSPDSQKYFEYCWKCKSTGALALWLNTRHGQKPMGLQKECHCLSHVTQCYWVISWWQRLKRLWILGEVEFCLTKVRGGRLCILQPGTSFEIFLPASQCLKTLGNQPPMHLLPQYRPLLQSHLPLRDHLSLQPWGKGNPSSLQLPPVRNPAIGAREVTKVSFLPINSLHGCPCSIEPFMKNWYLSSVLYC